MSSRWSRPSSTSCPFCHIAITKCFASIREVTHWRTLCTIQTLALPFFPLESPRRPRSLYPTLTTRTHAACQPSSQPCPRSLGTSIDDGSRRILSLHTSCTIMRFSQAGLLVACVPAAVSARFIEPLESDNHAVLKPRNAPFKIETVPGRFKWVTEDEKMLLKLVCLPLALQLDDLAC